MLRRVRWLGAGVAVGVATSVWTQRKAKVMAARYGPAGLASTALDRARGWPGEVRAAVAEGRATMRQREAQLRQDLERSSKS